MDETGIITATRTYRDEIQRQARPAKWVGVGVIAAIAILPANPHRKTLGACLAAAGWAVIMAAHRLAAGPHRQEISRYLLLGAVTLIGVLAFMQGFAMMAGKRLQWFGPWRDHE